MQHWRGDDGVSDTRDRQALPKDDLQFDVLGTLDEASSALGLARALAVTPRARELVLEAERDLCWMMSELAAQNPATVHKQVVDAARVTWLDEAITQVETASPRAHGFVAPGDHIAGAALHLARTVVRRAERLLVRWSRETHLQNPFLLPYLNHLSVLLYDLARHEDSAGGISSPTMARREPPPAP